MIIKLFNDFWPKKRVNGVISEIFTKSPSKSKYFHFLPLEKRRKSLQKAGQ